MKRIALTKGYFAIVDEADFHSLSKFKWCSYCQGRYAGRNSKRVNGRQVTVLMHRFLMNPQQSFEVDHINGNGLDNRRENLRLCSRSENAQNMKCHADCSSGVKGVYRAGKKWMAVITANGKRFYLGSYPEKLEAAKAYNAASEQLHGKFGKQNTIYV